MTFRFTIALIGLAIGWWTAGHGYMTASFFVIYVAGILAWNAGFREANQIWQEGLRDGE